MQTRKSKQDLINHPFCPQSIKGEIYTAWDLDWVITTIERLPVPRWRASAVEKYDQIFSENGKRGFYEANTWLRLGVENLSKSCTPSVLTYGAAPPVAK